MIYYIEKYGPFSLGIIVAILAKFYFPKEFLQTEFWRNLSNNFFTLSTTLLGFLLTITTILKSISTRAMDFIKDANKISELQQYLSGAIYMNFISLLFCLLYILIEKIIPNEVVILSILIFTWTISYSFRFTYILVNIVK